MKRSAPANPVLLKPNVRGWCKDTLSISEVQTKLFHLVKKTSFGGVRWQSIRSQQTHSSLLLNGMLRNLLQFKSRTNWLAVRIAKRLIPVQVTHETRPMICERVHMVFTWSLADRLIFRSSRECSKIREPHSADHHQSASKQQSHMSSPAVAAQFTWSVRRLVV